MKIIATKLYRSRVVRYFLSAGTATCVDVFVYYLSFNHLLKKQDFHIYKSFLITAPILSLMISYSCGLVTNFLISRYFVFPESTIKVHHQFIRYLLVAFGILIANYILMKFLIEILNWYPTLSRGFSALSIGVLSYIIHKSFSFKNADKQ